MAVAQDAAAVSGALTGGAECPEPGGTREERRDTGPADGKADESRPEELAFHQQRSTSLESTPADRSQWTEEEAGATPPPKDVLGVAGGDAATKTTAGNAATDATKTTAGCTATDATKTTAGSAATVATQTTAGCTATDATKTTAGSAATVATKTTAGCTATDATKTTAGCTATDATKTTVVSAATDATKTTAGCTATNATKTTAGCTATDATKTTAGCTATKTTAGNTSVKTTIMTLSNPPEPKKTALDKELEALLCLGAADPPPHDVLVIQSEQNGTTDMVKTDPSLEEAAGTKGKGPPPPLRAATTWTSANLREFKHRMAGEKHGLLTIRRGEVLTVRVPTHPDGKRLCWEFATDDYDIGFGIYFDWTPVTSTAVTLQVSESSDEDEEEDGESPWHSREGDVERGSVYRLRSRYGEILQICRRDSHREVQAGSHEYPGEGVYLLKLDNSYSLLRNKTLYFHVYYSS